MNSYDLADRLEQFYQGTHIQKAAETLRTQADELNKVIPQLVKANGLIENLRIRVAELEKQIEVYEARGRG
jgi:D-serine dehydratase